MKVAVFLAEGFEEVEALTPVDLLQRCGAEVTLVGVTGKVVTGRSGISVVADCEMDGFSADDADMVFLPGGMPGTKNLYETPAVCEVVKKAVASDRYVAAICAAPSIILGGLGVLEGKKATCYPGMEDGMVGAEAVAAPYVVDGKIITGRGAGAALDFGLALCEALYGHARASELAVDICYAAEW